MQSNTPDILKLKLSKYRNNRLILKVTFNLMVFEERSKCHIDYHPLTEHGYQETKPRVVLKTQDKNEYLSCCRNILS